MLMPVVGFAPQFAGEAVPTLEQVLQWAGERLYLNLEIKEYAAGMAVKELLSQFPHCRRAYFLVRPWITQVAVCKRP